MCCISRVSHYHFPTIPTTQLCFSTSHNPVVSYSTALSGRCKRAHTHGHIWVGIHTYKCTLVDTHSTTDPISQHLALSFVHTLQSGFCKSAGFCCTVLHADGVGMRAICAASSILTTAACRWMQSRDPSLTCEARQNMWALNMVQIASLPLSNQHTDFCCCGFCFCSVRNKQVLHSKLRWWSTLMYRKQCHSEPR